jgi:prevent-host-death family protein
MMRRWQLKEAKSESSKVVAEAIRGEPQLITKRGVEAVVLLSYAEYRRLIVTQQKLSTFFRASPLVEASLDLRRDTSRTRPEPTL